METRGIEVLDKAMKPSKDNRKKFDIDLEYGEAMEDSVAEMLQGKKIEVK